MALLVVPMFLVSGPWLVIACCRAWVAGTLPSLNALSTEGFADWLQAIAAEVSGAESAPFGVNLILHTSNPRREVDLAAIVRHRGR